MSCQKGYGFAHVLSGINKTVDVFLTFVGRRYRCDKLRHKLHRFDFHCICCTDGCITGRPLID